MYLLAILIPSAEFDAFIAEMEASPTSPLSVGRPALVWVLIGYSVFQILLQLPPLIAPAMGLEGYFGASYAKADRYLKGQLEGYIKLMSCQFLSVQIATAGLLFMTPSLYPVIVVYCFLNAYGIVLFSHNVINAEKFGIVIASQIPWIVLSSLIEGIAIGAAMTAEY